MGVRVYGRRSWLKKLRSSGLIARGLRPLAKSGPQERNGMGRGKDQARPWAARRDAVDRASLPRPSRLQAQGRRAPFKLGRGGTLGPELGRSGHYAQDGDRTARNLAARMSPWETDHCAARFPFRPTALTRIYRQQRRHLGGALTAPCAHGSPRKGGGCPGRHLNKMVPRWALRTAHSTEPGVQRLRETCSGSQEVSFRRDYSYSNKAKATSSEIRGP